jgi:D-lactate dehydrogenase (cytochrome)
VLASGEVLEIRRGQVIARQGTLRIPLPAGRSADLPVPTYRFRFPKNAAGYFAEDGMDLVDLFVGSEGTLGVVTRIELKVLPRPESVFSGILFFNTELDCFRFAARAKGWARAAQRLALAEAPPRAPAQRLALAEAPPRAPAQQKTPLSPRALEFFDSCSLRLLSEKHPDTPEHAGAALLFEQECSKSEQEALLQEWTGASESAGASASDCWFSHRPEDHREFRKFRYDLPVLVNEKVARNGFRKVGTDCAVPDPGAEEMFRFTLEEQPKSQMVTTLWGHLGDNHLHANFLPATQEEFKRALAFYERIARKAIELGGTISAEHGIGKLRIPYLEMMVGREGLLEMARVKKGLDPRGILSPGNIFPIELLQEV